MALPRFLAPSLDPGAAEVALPADEAHHLTRVLRLRPGAEVEVFDGRGREFVARVLTANRDRVTVALVAPCPARAPVHPAVTLVQAILKGDKMDDVVRDSTMLGVARIVPLISAHVARSAGAVESGRAIDRWRRVALASVKQCRRTTLPVLEPATRFDVWLRARRASPEDEGMTLFLVEPATVLAETRTIRSLIGCPPPTMATIAVGPEGGWSAEEVRAAVSAGLTPVTLGPLTLRAEAVALVAMSALTAVWGG